MSNVEAGAVGVVAIGRNEGERLKRCLYSVLNQVEKVVYVDSGSTDASVEIAQCIGVDVLPLNSSRPFCMSRARNEGFERLMEIVPTLTYVQFVDGDSELVEGWIEKAVDVLESEENVGAVSGHLVERYPRASIYNRVIDMDWRSIPGESNVLGGNLMMRAQSFRDVGGYNAHLIAGEDPEICMRLRAQGWKLLCLDYPMARHDVAITKFTEWWKRAIRSGHAYAEVAWLHRITPERPWRRQVWRHWGWGLILPLVIMAGLPPTSGLSLSLLILYPAWAWKIARNRRRYFRDHIKEAWLYGGFCMLAKVPLAMGQLLFWWRRFRGTQATLIEYKSTTNKDKSYTVDKTS